MKIEKSTLVSWYEASVYFRGMFIIAFGQSHTEALVGCLKKMEWRLY